MRVVVEHPDGSERRGFLIGQHSFNGREICVVRMEEDGSIKSINAKRVKEDPMEGERIASVILAGVMGGIVVVVGIGILNSLFEIFGSILHWILR